MTARNITIFVCILLFVSFVAACGGDEYTGVYKPVSQSDSGSYIELESDGKIIVGAEWTDEKKIGTYQINGNKLVIQWDDQTLATWALPKNETATIEGNTITDNGYRFLKQ